MVTRFTAPLRNKTGFRVLVIDDNELNRETTAQTLARYWPFSREMQVVWARDAGEALMKLRGQRFTLVLVNRRASQNESTVELRQLRDHGVELPAVVVSGLDSPELIAELKSLAAAHLPLWDMDKLTFHDAIDNSLRLLGRLPSDTQPIAAE